VLLSTVRYSLAGRAEDKRHRLRIIYHLLDSYICCSPLTSADCSSDVVIVRSNQEMESSASSCSSTFSLKENAVEDTPPSLLNPDMRWYTFDEEKLAEVRRQCPWKNDPKFFKRVVVSPSAVMKMVCL